MSANVIAYQPAHSFAMSDISAILKTFHIPPIPTDPYPHNWLAAILFREGHY